MRRLRLPGGLRARLTIAIATILAVALGATFVAVYSGTGSDVQRAIDGELRQAVTGVATAGVPRHSARPAEVARVARRYVMRQSFRATARLLVVRVSDGPIVTNQPDLVGTGDGLAESEPPGLQGAEGREARVLRAAPAGFSTVTLGDVGAVRLLVAPVAHAGRRLATVTVGESLQSVDRARDGVARTFVVAGSIALVLAALAGYLVAASTSRPLRRMARTAAEVDAGELSLRIGAGGPRDEVRVLADAFDRMLDRLEDAFARQRGFVGDASHELRTPLTVIRGQLEVLSRQRDITAGDVRRVEALVRTEVVRMERLVDDLLLLARADEGELVRPEPLELEPFVGELFDGLTLTGERRFELGPVPGGVLRADPDRIAQVVRNLARNAIEHTAPGGLVRLTATTRGDRLELAIEDDGPGIPDEQRARVFDRFHRTDAARARAGGGAGLGLAIAAAIVEAHRGRIFVERSPEGGARVAFELPGYAPGAARPPAPRAAPAPR